MRQKLSFSLVALLLILGLFACDLGGSPADPLTDETPATEDTTTTDEDVAAAAATSTVTPTSAPTATPTPTPEPFPPLVLQSDPQRGAEIAPDAAVSITFDQPMDREAVEAAFNIEPAVAGELAWADDTRVSFTPSQTYERDQRYTLHIAETARSAAGLTLNRPYELTFNTAGFLSVSSTQPNDGSSGIDLSTPVTVLFNRPVVPLVAIENEGDLPQPLSFEPPIDGTGVWLNTSIYQFTPADTFAPDTDYTATIEGGLSDVAGNVMTDTYSFSFRTAPPAVVATYPDDGVIYVSPTSVISVAFNQPVDRAAVEDSFTVLALESGEAVPGDLRWSDSGLTQPADANNNFYDYNYGQGDGPEAVGVETLTFIPGETYTLDTVYAVDLGGDDAGSERYSFSFRTVPPLTVESTFPQDGREDISPFTDLEISFSAPVDAGSVKVGRNVLIDPTIEVTRVYTYFWDSNTELVIDLPTEASSAYTVTLGGDIRSRYGEPLGEDVRVTWQTRAADPSIYLHRAGEVGTFGTFTTTTAYVTVRNLSQTVFSLYRLSEDEFVRLNGDSSWEVQRNFRPESEALRQWSLDTSRGDLNANVIYGTRLSQSEDGVLDPGLYYLEVTASKDDVYLPNLDVPGRQTMVFVVSDYNLSLKSTATEGLAWLNTQTGNQPFPGAVIRFRNEETRLNTAITDGDGIAYTELGEAVETWRPLFAFSDEPFAVAISTWSSGIEGWQFNLPTEYFQSTNVSYFYTDRAIYRPDQTVYYRGILRLDDDARYTLPPEGMPITITVYDSQGKEILSEERTLSEAGTLHGEIPLDAEAALGFYNIEARFMLDGQDQYGGAGFQVAEYRPPEYLVEVTTDEAEYRNGDTIELRAEASYFFGGPVANADVRYNILSEDYFFRYDGPGFYDFTDFDFSRSRSGYIGGFGELIEEGTGQTDADGRFTLEVSADIAERIASQRFTLEAVITDPDTDQVVSGRSEAIVHKGDYYIGLRPERYVSQAGRESLMNLITVDWDSQAVPNQDVTVVFNKHNWYSVQVQGDDGRFFWDSVVEDIPVLTTTATTDAEGMAQVGFVPEEGGIYKVVASGLDGEGNLIRSSAYIWISGRSYVNWRQENNDRLDLVTDKREYEVGDTATVLIPHPYSGTVTALISLERGHIYEYEVRALPTNSEQLEIPITADMVPNMFVSVLILKAPDETNPIPSFKIGYAQLPIDVTEKEINITLTPDKAEDEFYRPGEEVTYTVLATDVDGNPVEAELSLALVDKAVLSLAEENRPDLLETFWRQRGLGVRTASSLAVSNDRVNLTVAPEAKGGGGGAFDSAFGAVRGDFRDTAFWVADFTTDADGQGTVTTTLPDNLTTWVLTARGITRDTLVGDQQVEIVSTKPVLVRPVTPRFFVVGDEAELRMVVQNNTDETLSLETLFEGEGVALVDTAAADSIELAGGERQTLRYPIEVGTAAEAVLRFGARGGGYSDAVELTLPVHRYITPETVGTAGVLDEDEVHLEGLALPASFDDSAGELNITLEPSLAAGMRAGLDYLEHFPYECTEQTVSRFLPNVVTYRAYQQLDLDNPELGERLPGLVSQGLQRLYAHQKLNGGWGWFINDNSDPNLTAYVLLGLVEAQRAGFAVDDTVLSEAIAYLENALLAPRDVERSWQANRQAFVLYALAEADAGDLGRTVRLYDQRAQLDHFGRAYLALALALMEGEDDSRVQTLLNDITGAAVVSATGAHWEEANPDYFSMNTDIRSTAIILAALSRLDPDNALAPNTVRWLMSAREADYWATTQETAWAIIGLTDWMVATDELEGNYAWGVALNGSELDSGTVSPDTIDEKQTLQVAVADLLTDEVNRLVIERTSQSGNPSLGRLYYTAHLTYFKPVEDVEALERGIVVGRQYSLANDPEQTPITSARVGDIINVRVSLVASGDLHYVMLEDPIPAGTEGVDTSLRTTSVVGEAPDLTRSREDGWGWWWFSHTELRDEKAALFATYLPRGTYEYTYQIRASLPGTFRVIPTHAEQMYFPEVFGRGDGRLFTITE